MVEFLFACGRGISRSHAPAWERIRCQHMMLYAAVVSLVQTGSDLMEYFLKRKYLLVTLKLDYSDIKPNASQ